LVLALGKGSAAATLKLPIHIVLSESTNAVKTPFSLWIPRGILFLAFIAVLSFGILSQSTPQQDISFLMLHLAIILLGELFLLSWLLGRLLEGEISLQRIDVFVFAFLLGSLFLVRPFMNAVWNNEFLEVAVIARIEPTLAPAYHLLVVICSVFAVFALRQIVVFHKDLVAEMRRRRAEEHLQEEKRRARFTHLYPRLGGSPLAGRLLGFLAGEGGRVLGAVTLLVIAGAALRLWNLDALVPYADEYRHLNAAKLLLTGEPWSQLEYRRSLYTVTLPVLLSFKALGASLWSARFGGVVAHLLAVIPLYLIVRRIGKGAAVLAVGLYLLDPWLIQSSRLVREYAYYPLYFFTILLALVELLESIPDGVVWRRDLRRLVTPKNLLYCGILLLAPVYFLVVDPLSTFRTVAVVYPAFALALLLKMDWSARSNRILGVAAIGLAAVAVAVLVRDAGSPGSPLTGRFIPFYFRLLYESPVQQMYFQRASISFLVLLAAFFGASYFGKGQKTSALLLLVYLLALLAFATLALKDNRPRYGVSIQLWHVPVMALGLYAAILVLQKHFHRLLPWGLAAALLLAYYWNIPHSLTPALSTQPGFAPISDDFHPDLAPAYERLRAESEPGEALVAAETFLMYLDWVDAPPFDPAIEYLYDSKNPQEIIYAAIESYPRGWVVLDYRTGYQWTRPLPFEDFEHAGKTVRFLGWFGDQYIFQWTTPGP
jgi:hypothetical protein